MIMKVLGVIILFFCHIQANSQSDMKLIYVGDPMCSWCYGFGPEWHKTIDIYSEKMDVEYVMGGLRPYYEKPMIEMKSFLSEHWEQVHNATGQPFTYGILDRSDLNYDTEPPSRAVIIVRQMKPEVVPEFFSKVQSLFYYENKNMNLSETYHEVLEELDIDKNEFDKIFSSQAGKDASKIDFRKAAEMGAQSFPTVLLENNGEYYIVVQGYASSDNVSQSIDRLITKLSK